MREALIFLGMMLFDIERPVVFLKRQQIVKESASAISSHVGRRFIKKIQDHE